MHERASLTMRSKTPGYVGSSRRLPDLVSCNLQFEGPTFGQPIASPRNPASPSRRRAPVGNSVSPPQEGKSGASAPSGSNSSSRLLNRSPASRLRGQVRSRPCIRQSRANYIKQFVIVRRLLEESGCPRLQSLLFIGLRIACSQHNHRNI